MWYDFEQQKGNAMDIYRLSTLLSVIYINLVTIVISFIPKVMLLHCGTARNEMFFAIVTIVISFVQKII